MKNTWNIVHDCDLDDGTPTEWSLKIAENTFYWIDAMADFTFNLRLRRAHRQPNLSVDLVQIVRSLHMWFSLRSLSRSQQTAVAV